MRRSAYLLALVLLLVVVGSAQQAKPDWNSWSWLLGTWDGSGSGKPGEGGGWFSLKPQLDGQILVRHNHSEYPASADKPAVTHDDLMVIYPEGKTWRADYWDVEGHVIHYEIEIASHKATFTSDRKPGTPGFRLVYELQPNGELAVIFSMASPGSSEFKTYVSGTVHRRKE